MNSTVIKKHLKKSPVLRSLLLMVIPFISVAGIIALYAIINLIFIDATEPSSATSSAMYHFVYFVRFCIYIALFLAGVLSFFLGPVLFMTGAVMLVISLIKKKRAHA